MQITQNIPQHVIACNQLNTFHLLLLDSAYIPFYVYPDWVFSLFPLVPQLFLLKLTNIWINFLFIKLKDS